MATQEQHKANDFTPVVSAMEHAEYVLHITQSPKWFHDYSAKESVGNDGRATKILVFHDDSLSNIVRAEARQIYHLTFTANEINLKRQPWRKGERLSKQAEAIALCSDMLADIQLCRRHFHLTAKRIRHWGSMVIALRTAIEHWHESDKDRYKDI